MRELELLSKLSLHTNLLPWKAPTLQAHRGYWQSGDVENSILSFRKAYENGYRMAECDVRLSKDLVPMLYHDDQLSRLHKDSRDLSFLSASELRNQFNISPLEELLDWMPADFWLNIELKGMEILDAKVETLVSALIHRSRAAERVVFSSFNPFKLMRLKKMTPQIPCGWLVSPSPEKENMIFLRKMWAWPLIPFDFLDVHESMVTESLLELCQKKQVPLVVWTVNDLERAQQLLKMGVVSVITDTVLPEKIVK